MRRRAFIVSVMCAITIAGARAQQTEKVYRIAIIHPSARVSELSETATSASGAYPAFFQRLHELGYVEGQNLRAERYSAEGREDRFAELVAQVIRSDPDLIFVVSSRLTRDFKAATDAIPMVAALVDPVAFGIVPSLARPGANITGVTGDAGLEIVGKRLELLHELVPPASRVAYLASRRVWEAPGIAIAREAAQRMNILLVGPPLDPPIEASEYRRVLVAMKQAGVDALIVEDQPENNSNARLIVELAENTRLPAIYPYPYYTDLGGLLGYGIDQRDMFRRAAEQVDQILKGTKPGDIPFYQPTKFKLSINLKTAKALGIAVPPTLLIAADEVIE